MTKAKHQNKISGTTKTTSASFTWQYILLNCQIWYLVMLDILFQLYQIFYFGLWPLSLTIRSATIVSSCKLLPWMDSVYLFKENPLSDNTAFSKESRKPQISIIIHHAFKIFPKIIYSYVVALIIVSGARKDTIILQSITPIRCTINRFGFAGLTQVHRLWYSFCLAHPPLVSNDIDKIIWWHIWGNIENKRWSWTKHIHNFQSKGTNWA